MHSIALNVMKIKAILAALLCTVALHGNAVEPNGMVIPANAKLYLPIMKQQIAVVWPDLTYPYYMAAQAEQESCYSLTAKGCWNPHTELKTSREYGFGLGQLTIAYDANGKVRFNNFQYMTKKYALLNSWKYSDRYNPKYQIDALLLLDKESFTAVSRLTPNDADRYHFMFSAYNGGLGGVIQDRKLCSTIKGCDPNKWYGNVADHSYKAKTKIHGYGQSAFETNRGYVINVEQVRSPKYKQFFEAQ